MHKIFKISSYVLYLCLRSMTDTIQYHEVVLYFMSHRAFECLLCNSLKIELSYAIILTNSIFYIVPPFSCKVSSSSLIFGSPPISNHAAIPKIRSLILVFQFPRCYFPPFGQNEFKFTPFAVFLGFCSTGTDYRSKFAADNPRVRQNFDFNRRLFSRWFLWGVKTQPKPSVRMKPKSRWNVAAKNRRFVKTRVISFPCCAQQTMCSQNR